MLIFLVLTVATLLLLTVLLGVLFPGLVRVLQSRVRRQRDRPAAAQERQGDVLGMDLGAAAVQADLQGAPAAGDTCDRCAMSAAAAAYLPRGRLLLCGHHGRQHQSVLRRQGAVIVGELGFPRAATAA